MVVRITYVVGTGELLQSLKTDPQGNPVSHSRSPEHSHPLGDDVALSLLLFSELGLDLLELGVHGVVMRWCSKDLDHGLKGFLGPAFSIVVTWGIREEEDSNSQNEEEGPSNTDDDSPRSRAFALVLVHSIVEACGKKDTQGDEQLVGRDESSTNPRRRCLRFE